MEVPRRGGPAVRRPRRPPEDNPTIGLILCSRKNEAIAIETNFVDPPDFSKLRDGAIVVLTKTLSPESLAVRQNGEELGNHFYRMITSCRFT